MIGAIAGDVIGSVHEGSEPQSKDFALLVPESCFTDDSVLTIAIATAIRTDGDYAAALREWGRQYPDAGYGGLFSDWLESDTPRPYQSFGNGSAMRVAPIAWAYDTLDRVLEEARRSAEVTHDHPEGIKGAQAVAAAVYLGRTGASKADIHALLSGRFGYDCGTLSQWKALAKFDVTCQGTVPAAAAAFLESTDFEDAVRNAVSLGGDADTLACIAGALAEAYYGRTPEPIQRQVLGRLDFVLYAHARAFADAFAVPVTAPA